MEIRYVLGYICLLSLVGFLLMGFDKYKAKKGLWRIPEKNLFLIAILGGSAGAVVGMYLFHHKTRHWYFRYGLPAILLLQSALLIVCYRANCPI